MLQSRASSKIVWFWPLCRSLVHWRNNARSHWHVICSWNIFETALDSRVSVLLLRTDAGKLLKKIEVAWEWVSIHPKGNHSSWNLDPMWRRRYLRGKENFRKICPVKCKIQEVKHLQNMRVFDSIRKTIGILESGTSRFIKRGIGNATKTKKKIDWLRLRPHVSGYLFLSGFKNIPIHTKLIQIEFARPHVSETYPDSLKYSGVKTCFHISKCPWTWGAWEWN